MGESTPAFAHASADCAQKNDYDRTIRGCSAAIQQGIDLVVAYNNRGIAYMRKSDYDQAIGDFTKAIEIDPNYVRSIACRKQHDYDRIIGDRTQAIARNPKEARVGVARLAIYRQHPIVSSSVAWKCC